MRVYTPPGLVHCPQALYPATAKVPSLFKPKLQCPPKDIDAKDIVVEIPETRLSPLYPQPTTVPSGFFTNK